ncbi:hypothetical protein MASR1M97_15260 [Candidatus Desulfobacillus denitrificans]|uniref:Uncharacterized protein n=1 Tax=Candidatus Desulfobacillus denitrificans TaxID=2608985 RepID=A0A809QWS4_9PROT|nr:conserved hypothetical protein [Candidatus Desulfobacillus denitrificans]
MDFARIMKTTLRRNVLTAALLALGCLPAAAADDDESPLWDFVRGRYTLIGRQPDSQATYTGTAKIERVGRQLRLTRVVAGRQERIVGAVRRADPGEAWVLAFKWGDRQPMEMVCLVGSDLDNYARLTCHWGRAGNPHAQPGMEAYFAQEPWDPVK